MTADLLSIAAKRVYYLDQSQNILARNIANIDTPGYTPQTAPPFSSTLAHATAGTLVTTHTNDLQPADSTTMTDSDAVVSERAPDGNAVSLNQELAAVARTQINQQYAVNIYKSYIGMFTTALGPNP
ncbi:MAG: flagellar basal body protein [Acidiphilium sp.]|nr:flagellar basal body protein [Acidiphilium sp.]MDD4936097.1 flagellar basal body protein [Acidiphilium sp.]